MLRTIPLALMLLAACSQARASDPGRWQLASDQRDDKVELRVWLRPGDSLERWREMLSTLETLVVSGPHEISESARQGLLAACPGMTWTYHRRLPDDVIYQFEAPGCEDQGAGAFEVGRITKLPGTRVFRVAYASRDLPEKSVRQHWLGLIGTGLGTPAGAPKPGQAPVLEPPRGTRGPGLADDDEGAFSRLADGMLAEHKAGRPVDSPAVGTRESSGYGGSRSGPTVEVRGIRRISLHEMARGGGPGEEVAGFTPMSTQLYAVAHLETGLRARALRFEWHALDGAAATQPQPIVSKTLALEPGYDSAVTYLTFSGLNPVGNYRVLAYLDDELAGGREFVIARR